MNGKYYIGKGKDLYKRISDYYRSYYLQNNKHSSLIVKAILKYGMESFVLLVLDINTIDLFLAEQKFINLLSPVYNQVLNVGKENLWKAKKVKQVGSFLGKKHTPEAIALFRKYASERQVDPKPGFRFIITDTVKGTTEEFPSIRKGVKAMG